MALFYLLDALLLLWRHLLRIGILAATLLVHGWLIALLIRPTGCAASTPVLMCLWGLRACMAAWWWRLEISSATG